MKIANSLNMANVLSAVAARVNDNIKVIEGLVDQEWEELSSSEE